MGKTRAKQYSLLKTSPDDCKLGDKAMCVQIHGDASFAGQGVIMESLGLSQLPRMFIRITRLIVINRQPAPLYKRGKYTFGRRVRLPLHKFIARLITEYLEFPATSMLLSHSPRTFMANLI